MMKKYLLTDRSLISDVPDDANIHVYINPDDIVRQALLSSLRLDPHSLSSALDPDEISRVEFTGEQVFIIWKNPENYSFQESIKFNVSSIGMVLQKERLVLIMTEEIDLIDEKQTESITSVSGMLLHLLLHTTRHFLEHLKVIREISREIQLKINTALENEYLIQMFTLGESLTCYLNAVTTNTVVLTKIRNNSEKMGFTAALSELLDDIIIENNQCAKQAEIYLNILSGLMDARGTLVNNNMNVILKNLTIINTVFLPLNLIASVGGMSEYSIMTAGVDWRVSYAFFFLSMLIIGLMSTIFLHKFSWWQKNPNGLRKSFRTRRGIFASVRLSKPVKQSASA